MLRLYRNGPTALADRSLRRLQRSMQSRLYGDRYMEHIFTRFQERNHWGNTESLSGSGSNMVQTEEVRKRLPSLLKEFNIKTMLDIPCGDFHWMKEVPLYLDQYIGADIVSALVSSNSERYANDRRIFVTLDVTKNNLPKVDLVFCRDCLVHLSTAHIADALRNIKASGAEYLLTTTFTERERNREIVTGGWRPLNLQLAPFAFPSPIVMINEECFQDGGRFRDKCLALWSLEDIDVRHDAPGRR
jgi:predicted TPR repeat methyltransferase